ncbi:hypothetical protein LOTGIDRAFT_170051 [Lottia gigantea]|uniref:Stanniocalcin-like protein n=1 Tax=Lottia gigantea TaxID=225164 RepID=V3ZNJ6_LOTGI|nr:hypothetical protein LOTGIDRAFT_170051 [Lottia gigantea]ESO82421.1 hypothetical protein LOTGIDRAFT_170051 [Lottia gigantea]
MKMINIFIVVYCLISPCLGFWLSSKTVDPKVDISTECINKALTGDCGFFTCFEERLPCGEYGYAESYGGKYCWQFQQSHHLFTKKGVEFVEKLTRCHMNRSITSYRQNQIECFSHYDQSFVIMGDCYVESGFCDVVIDNFMSLARILEPKDFTNYRVVREVFRAAKQCPNNISGGIISKFLSYKRGSSL